MSSETFRCGDAERPSANDAARMSVPGASDGAAVRDGGAAVDAAGGDAAGVTLGGVAARHASAPTVAAVSARTCRRVSVLVRP